AIGGRVLLRNATFAVERGEHVALVGPNGSGKTTLLERLVRGDGLRIGHGVQIGYFSQQEMELDTRGTILQCVQNMTGLSRPDAQNLLGRFLVLDEPTNHLDLESREALEAALDAFPGTVLLVSHDRALLDAIAERTLAIEDRTIRAYDGGWAELLRAREAREARARPPEPAAESAKPKQAPKPKLRRRSAL